MTAQQLKNSILQLAVQGKLVPQDPNDEPASVLLERIRAEKEALIKAKKIKREKNPSVIFRGADNTPYEKIGDKVVPLEVPFDIPDTWEWVRFVNLVDYAMGKTPPRKESIYWDHPKYPWVSIADMISDGKVTVTKEGISDYAAKNSFKGRISPAGTLLMSFKLTVGKVSILGIDAYHNEAIISIFPFIDDQRIMTAYLFKILPLISQTGDTKTAIKGNTLNSDSLDNLLVPLPSLAEQQRIVSKLDELAPVLTSYEQAETASRRMENAFPEQLKKSILQWAVQGKLVPQDPSDEPAEALLERIRGEKEQLVREGKIKKDKHESIILRRDNSHYEKRGVDTVCIDDALPFDIPETWCWTRLSSIAIKEVKRGKSPQYAENGSVYVVAQKCNVKSGGINMSLAKYLAPSAFSKYPAEEQMLDRDIIVNSTGGGTLGRIGIFHDSDRTNDYPIVPDSHVTIVRTSCEFAEDYIFYVFKYYQPYLEALGEGSTNQTELKPAVIADLFVPVPPLSEQKRIVKALARVLDQLSLL